MANAERIDVEEARRHVADGQAVLVCAYADDEKCDKVRLDGALSLTEFERAADRLPRDREIVFYCA